MPEISFFNVYRARLSVLFRTKTTLNMSLLNPKKNRGLFFVEYHENINNVTGSQGKKSELSQERSVMILLDFRVKLKRKSAKLKNHY